MIFFPIEVFEPARHGTPSRAMPGKGYIYVDILDDDSKSKCNLKTSPLD